MRDQRLPDVAETGGATTEDTAPERDTGGPKPNAGLDRRQDRNSELTEKAQAQPGGEPDSAAPDPGRR